MIENKAFARAASTIFPAALVLFALRSIIESDLRELFFSWFSAIMISIFFFPVGFVLIWLIDKFFNKFLYRSLWLVLTIIVISYEIIFVLVINPLWENDLGQGFFALLVGVYGIATAVSLYFHTKNVRE